MKNLIKTIAATCSGTLGITLLVLMVLGILTFGTLFIQRWAYPYWLSIQRQSVEQSKSFTDANNNMLEQYKLEHSRLDTKIAETSNEDALVGAYKAQQVAIIGRMCTEIATMKVSTVNPATLAWLSRNGGCQ